ncbi:MAG: sulfite reductase flavoprotein subunit alpha [Acidobacteriota bacterium]
MSTTPSLVPSIPEDAPFTPAQRAWLNGYLAGLYSYAPAQTTATPPRFARVAVLYGSQTGTAEGLARKFAKELKSQGFSASVSSLEGYVPATLAAERCALFIVSTYGEGEAPDAAQPFFQQLCVEHFPLLGDLSFAVLALGDAHYEHFCQFGKELDSRLEALGGTRLMPRVDSDVDVDAPFAQWKKAIVTQLREPAPAGAASVACVEPAAPESPQTSAPPKYSRESPCLSVLAEKRALTHPSSSKLTIHLDFSTDGADLHYEAGDACGVIPQNSPALVDAVLRSLPFSGDETVEIPKVGAVTLREALMGHFAVNRLTRRIVSEYARLTQCAPLDALLAPQRQDELEKYLQGRDLIDLLREWPCVLQTPGDLLKVLPRLAPRLYSISSSPAAHPGRVHTTVSVVRYRAHDRDRGGVCSTLLADRVHVGDRLPIYIQPNQKFRLPADPAAPVVMIGPGTGVAPFRAFLHQRRATGATGRNWLFFGERSAATDFLYREELEAMRADGHLTYLDTAFSRDQDRKVYVQDLMMQNARQLWTWIDEGAFLYVCGDAERMAKDVDRTLRAIAGQIGGMHGDAALEYIETLRSERRYQRDVY